VLVNFISDKKNEIYHGSKKERLKIGETAKFGFEML
jgi:hypothetical protein